MGDSQETAQRGTVVPDTVPPTDHGRADELPAVLHGRARTAWRATATRSRLVLSRMITTVGRASRGGEIGGGRDRPGLFSERSRNPLPGRT